MKEKIFFEKINKNELFNFIKINKRRKILNFLNAHVIYFFNKDDFFKKVILNKNNLNFIDGVLISIKLSLFNFKKIPRIRGPTFTKEFLSNKKLSEEKRHLFIGLTKIDLKKLKEKFPHLKKISCTNLPYIPDIKFPKKEIQKLTKKINKENPDFVWVGIGTPKQHILTLELFNRTKATYFVNIGAALDFLLEKKKEAPLFIRNIGIEWLYRFITDFHHTKNKLIKSFISFKYLNTIK